MSSGSALGIGMTDLEETIEEIKNQDLLKAYREAHRAQYEYLRCITTLATGALIILPAVVYKIFENPMSMWFFVTAITFFFATVIISVITYTVRLARFPIMSMKKTSNSKAGITALSLILTCGCFLLAISYLAIFMIVNILVGIDW